MNTRFPPVAGVAVALALVLCARLDAADWLPIDPADLAAEKSALDPDASAEILYHEKTIDDSLQEGSKLQEYYRIKIYTDKGVEALDKIEIPSYEGERVTNLMARVIKHDGSIVNLDRKAFFTRDVVRKGRDRKQVKSFSFPGVEPGVIVEYRWDTYTEESVGGLYLQLQSEMPTRLLRFRVRPYPFPNLVMKTIFHRCEMQKLKPGKDDFYLIEMKDLPALKDESYLPPNMEYQSWILFYFTLEKETPEDYWQRIAKERLEPLEKKARPRKEVQAVLASLLAGAKDDAEKLARLHDFCRSQIRNIAHAAAGFTPDEIAALKKNESAADTLQRKYGTRSDIQALFVVLARAAGFDARFALASDRSEIFFDQKVLWSSVLSDLITAVKVGTEWKFFDPAATYVESGSLHWENEGVQALVLDAKKSTWVTTPPSPAAQSRTIRNARLTLDETGTIEGDVHFQYRGQETVTVKEDFGAKTPEEYEETIRTRLQRRLNGAEVSNVELKNAADPIAPVTLSYHIRVPGYAQRTGQRLFFQPAYFEKGRDATFTTSTREYDIYFSYSWSEEDEVNITFPAGYVLEEATSPGSLPKDGVINFRTTLGVTKAGDRMRLTRTFECRPIVIRKESYETLKDTFDIVHAGDEHTLILKRTVTETAEPPVAVPLTPATEPAAAAPAS